MFRERLFRFAQRRALVKARSAPEFMPTTRRAARDVHGGRDGRFDDWLI